MRHKSELSDFITRLNQTTVPEEAPAPDPSYPFTQGPSVGSIAALAAIAEQIAITKALGSDRAGLLALWQVIARALERGSRLSAENGVSSENEENGVKENGVRVQILTKCLSNLRFPSIT